MEIFNLRVVLGSPTTITLFKTKMGTDSALTPLSGELTGEEKTVTTLKVTYTPEENLSTMTLSLIRIATEFM